MPWKFRCPDARHHRTASRFRPPSFSGIYLYDKDPLARLLQHAVVMSYDASLAKDFDYAVSVISWSQDFVQHGQPCHPELFTSLRGTSMVMPSNIIVSAQWSNTGGAAQVYDDSIAGWFAKIEATADGVDFTRNAIVNSIAAEITYLITLAMRTTHHCQSWPRAGYFRRSAN